LTIPSKKFLGHFSWPPVWGRQFSYQFLPAVAALPTDSNNEAAAFPADSNNKSNAEKVI
jgi:hypothetical protein